MNTLKNILGKTLKHWREISIVYLIQLLLGLIVTIVFYREFSNHFNNSLVLDNLAKGFDRTVLMDLVNSQDGILTSTKFYGFIILTCYLFVGIFLQGGWIANIRKKEYSSASLFKNGLKYIGPFTGFALISIFLVLLVGGLIAFTFTSIVGDPLVTFSSEKPYILWIACLIVLFIFWAISVWSWSVISRCFYIDGNSFFKSFKLGFKVFCKNWLKFLSIGLLIIGLHVLFMLLYYWIMGDRGAPSWFVVCIGILVQQIFNYLRIALRGFGYGFVEELI